MNNKIDYNKLIRDAEISVARSILKSVEKNGFFKDQHLYITFALDHKDVVVSSAVKSDNDELTIVLQYEFWDLNVDEYGFSVGLAFDESNETIYVPFASLIEINDPSEDFRIELIPDYSQLKPKQNNVCKDNKEGNSNVISLDIFRKK